MPISYVSAVAAANPSVAATPPMGWNSCHHFACKVTAGDFRPAAAAIASNGMKGAEYEAVAIDQGSKEVQGRWVAQGGPLEVWAKPLADGSAAVGLLNRGEAVNSITVSFRDIGRSFSAKTRDLWQHKDLGSCTGSYTEEVPRHGAVLIKVQ